VTLGQTNKKEMGKEYQRKEGVRQRYTTDKGKDERA
jgi:hypothetical protein